MFGLKFQKSIKESFNLDTSDIQKQIKDLQNVLKDANFDDTADAFGDAVDNITASNVALENNIRLRFQLEEQQRRQAVVIAQTAKQEALLQGIVDDDTASLKERIEASKELGKGYAIKATVTSRNSRLENRRQIAENQIQVELYYVQVYLEFQHKMQLIMRNLGIN